MVESGSATESEMDAVDAEETQAVEDAVAFAEASPFPDAEEALDHLYATTEGAR